MQLLSARSIIYKDSPKSKSHTPVFGFSDTNPVGPINRQGAVLHTDTSPSADKYRVLRAS